jgi:short subunit dehydrogenase-like uncharacterized protein
VSSLPANFLLYGSTGFVGDAIAHLAVQSGLQPVLAGRNPGKLKAQAEELGLKYRVFDLEDSTALDQALSEVSVVLNCAGPYVYTYRLMLEGCLRTGVHYLDITGEIPVYEGIAARDADAKAKGVMLLPGVGFDVVPTDCLALHLKQRLPSATHLALAFQGQGPAGLPPGTQRTAIEMIPYGANRVRRNGRLEVPKRSLLTRLVDFGNGPIPVTRMSWGDIFTAYYSTGIPNIEDYLALPESTRRQLAMMGFLSPLFKLAAVRNFLKRAVVKPGPTADERARTVTHVWGEVKDEQGRRAVSRLNGPEAGVIWTARSALAAVQKVLAGNFSPGFQTPAQVYGADFALECEGVTREDLKV